MEMQISAAIKAWRLPPQASDSILTKAIRLLLFLDEIESELIYLLSIHWLQFTL